MCEVECNGAAVHAVWGRTGYVERKMSSSDVVREGTEQLEEKLANSESFSMGRVQLDRSRGGRKDKD